MTEWCFRKRRRPRLARSLSLENKADRIDHIIGACRATGIALGAEQSPQSFSATGLRAEFTADPRLELDSGQQRVIYQGNVNAEKQAAPKSMPTIAGAMAPESLELKELPGHISSKSAR
jgi:hypothetical protein